MHVTTADGYNADYARATALLDRLLPESAKGFATLEDALNEREKVMADALDNAWIEGITIPMWVSRACSVLGWSQASRQWGD